MLVPSGEIGKLRIFSFWDPKMNPQHVVGVMDALINPEGYERKYEIHYRKEQKTGSPGPPLAYCRTPAENMEFKFLFDRTGALPDSPPIEVGVTADIELFKRLTYEFHGSIHRSPYLKIVWGTLVFPCVLTTMNVQYKLFKSNGIPIRAEITASFMRFVDEGLLCKIQNLMSPDMTHIHEVKEGDSLPLLAHRIYGDARHYLEVARANNLINFKDLQPGQQLVFPPIEK